MSAFTNSGRFLSRFRLMPVRGFLFRLAVSVFGIIFRVFLGLAAVCTHIWQVYEGSEQLR